MRKCPLQKKALEKKKKKKKTEKKEIENFHAWFRWGCLSTQSNPPGSATGLEPFKGIWTWPSIHKNPENAKETAPVLCAIYQQSYDTEQVPLDWRQANVTAVGPRIQDVS